MLTVLFSSFRATSIKTPAVRLALAALLLTLGTISFVLPNAANAQETAPVVRVIHLDADIDQVSSRYLRRSIDNANSDQVELIVIRLDTPGGSLDSTREMVAAILESETPIAVYVGPGGAQAASAGTFISAASGLLAMAPATNIGAASVVDGSGEDLPSTLEKKVTEDTAAFIRSIAVERGRNADALEATVREAKAYSATDAIDLGIADLIANDLADLLAKADGLTIATHSGEDVISIANARVQEKNMPLIDRILDFLANPNIAFIFISIGTIALVVELWNPGVWIPGTIGAALMIIGFVGVGFLDFSWAGIAFIALAVLLLALEGQAPGASYFGVAGSIALVLGGIFLVGRFTDPDLPGGTRTVSIWLLAITGGVIISFVLWLAYQIRQAAKSPDYISESSSGALIGQEGLVTVTLEPKGEVHVAGEFWSAELVKGGRLEEGAPVRVVRVDGVFVFVEPARSGLRNPITSGV